MGILGDQIGDGQIPEGKLDGAVQAKLNITNPPAAAETRSSSGAIEAADNGKTLWVPSGNPQVDLTFAAGLSEGFEITVIVDVAQPCTVIPQAGQQMGIAGQGFLPAGDPAASASLSGGGSDISSAKWKLIGTQWAHISETGWGAVLPSVFFWLDHGSGIAVAPPDFIEVNSPGQTFGLRYGDINDPGSQPTVAFDTGGSEKDVILGGSGLVDAGSVVVGLPFTDPSTGLVVDDINPGSGTIEFNNGFGGGGQVDLNVQPSAGGPSDILIDVNVSPGVITLHWADGLNPPFQIWNDQMVIQKTAGTQFSLVLNDQNSGVPIDLAQGSYDLTFDTGNPSDIVFQDGVVMVALPYQITGTTGIVITAINPSPIPGVEFHLDLDYASAQGGESVDLVVNDQQDVQVMSNSMEVIGAPFSNFWASAFAPTIPAGGQYFTTALSGSPEALWSSNTSAFIASFWHRAARTPDAVSSVEPVILNQWRNDAGGGGQFHWAITIYDPNPGAPELRVRFRDSNTGNIWDYTAAGFSVGGTSWHHAMVVFDPVVTGGPLVYLDGSGIPVSDIGSSPGDPSRININAIPMEVAARLTETPTYSGTEGQYTGDLDEIAIWTRRPSRVTGVSDYNAIASEVFGAGVAVNLNDLFEPSQAVDDWPNRWWRFETPAVLLGQNIQNGHTGLENSAKSSTALDIWLPPGVASPIYTDGPSI
jgi:hypothetical protein